MRKDEGETLGIEIIARDAPLGAIVRCGDVRALDDVRFRAVYEAYLDHLVLVFRDQHLSDEELLAFSMRFGELENVEPMRGMKTTPPQLAIVSNVVENGEPIGRLGFGEAVWHTDSSFNTVPPSATLLYGLEVPAHGGDTGFANMYRAFETLPPELHDLPCQHDRQQRRDPVRQELLPVVGPQGSCGRQQASQRLRYLHQDRVCLRRRVHHRSEKHGNAGQVKAKVRGGAIIRTGGTMPQDIDVILGSSARCEGSGPGSRIRVPSACQGLTLALYRSGGSGDGG